MRNFIFDTNILMAYLKADNSLFTKVSQENELNKEDAFIIISAISVGEIRSLALQNNWGERKTKNLDKLLNQLVIIDVNGSNNILMDAYAEIDAYCHKRHPTKIIPAAKPMGKNDLWIAATAFATNSILLTTDGGFNPIKDIFIQANIYDPKII